MLHCGPACRNVRVKTLLPLQGESKQPEIRNSTVCVPTAAMMAGKPSTAMRPLIPFGTCHVAWTSMKAQPVFADAVYGDR